MSAPLLLVVLCTQAFPDVAAQVHFAFRQERGVFVAGHDTHRVEADASGTVSFFPIGDRDVGPAEVPLRLRVSSLGRGSSRLAVTPLSVGPGASSNVLELRRRDFTELLHNDADGVEQSFRFEAAPRGKGALLLDLETDARWLGHTRAGHHFAAGALSVVYGAAAWVTADGRRVKLQTTHTAKGLRITVPADLAARGPFPASIDPLVSAEFGVDAPVLVQPVGAQDGPAVAFDGTNFLVVWRDFRGGVGSDIYATRVDPLGVVLDPGGLPISLAVGGQYQPAVAFGAGEYYATWSDTRAGGSDIYGTRITTAGVPLDGSGVSLTDAVMLQVNSDVVFNGTDFLVVWEDLRVGGNNSPDIYGTRVTTAGAVLDPTPNLPISAGIWGQYLPRLDANPATGMTFVIWEDTRNLESDIYGALVDVSGVPGVNVAISRAAQAQDKADVAFNGTNFIAVWTDRRSTTSADIYGARISQAGVLLDPTGVGISTGAGDQDQPAIAGRASQFAVWRDGRNVAITDIYGSPISASAGPVVVLGTPVSNAAQPQAEPKLALGTAGFFAAFSDLRNGNSDVFGSRISLAGAVVDPLGIPLNVAANQQGQVALASDGVDFLAVWQDFRNGGADLYGMRLDAAGTFLDAVAFPISVAAGNESAPAVAWDGLQYVVAWTDVRSGVNHVMAARVTNAGVVLDTSGIPIAPNVAEAAPSVASVGAGSLIAWQDSRAGTLDVYVARLSQTGQVLDTSGVPVSTAVGEQSGVKAIAFNGGYLLAWMDLRAGNADVYAARVDAAAVVQDVSGIPVSTNAAAADSISLSASATQALVVWRDSRTAGNVDIFGARLDTSGAVLDPSGLTITGVVGNQAAPTVGWDVATTTWAVYWEDLTLAADGEVYGADVDVNGVAGAAQLVGSGRAPTVLYSAAKPGLLGYTRFVAGAGFNHFRAKLRLSGKRANGAPCTVGSDCLSGVCAATCTSIVIGTDAGSDGGLDAGFDAGVDAGPDDAGLDAGPEDAGVDAGEVDAGEVDAGAVDAGAVDAGDVDAGDVDAGGFDAGPVANDAGPGDAGLAAPVFVNRPGPDATCTSAWTWTPTMSGAGPFTFSLRTAPTGMTVAADGRLDWSPLVGGTEPVVLVASGPGGDTELDFDVTVSCPRRTLGVSCGCDASSGLWVFALVFFARRRRSAAREER